MTRRILLFTMLALCAFAASASRHDTVRKQVEASMLVTGELVVAPDGAVKSYKLDRADALPPGTAGAARGTRSGHGNSRWQKADGSPLQAPAAVKMSVQLRGAAHRRRRPVPGHGPGHGVLGPEGAGRGLSKGELTPPKYPPIAYRSGMSGIVYVVLRLNPDGTVAETHVERVDMTVLSR